MTFLRTSASCTPSNFGTPARLGAACAAAANRVKSRPASNARQPTGTGAFVVTRQHSSIRNLCFTRTNELRIALAVFAVLPVLAGIGCATARGGPHVVFDQTSRFGRVLVIDEGPRRVMRFGSPSGSEQSAVEL